MTTDFTIKSMAEFISQSPVFIDYALRRFMNTSRLMNTTINDPLELSVIYTNHNGEFIVVWHTDLSYTSDMHINDIKTMALLIG